MRDFKFQRRINHFSISKWVSFAKGIARFKEFNLKFASNNSEWRSIVDIAWRSCFVTSLKWNYFRSILLGFSCDLLSTHPKTIWFWKVSPIKMWVKVARLRPSIIHNPNRIVHLAFVWLLQVDFHPSFMKSSGMFLYAHERNYSSVSA